MKCPKCNGKWVPDPEYGIGGHRCMICGHIQLGERCEVVCPLPEKYEPKPRRSDDDRRNYYREYYQKNRTTITRQQRERRLATCRAK